jgi:hypothetical protein
MSLIILEISPSYLNERMGEALTLHPLSPMNNGIQQQGEGLLFSTKQIRQTFSLHRLPYMHML